LNRTANTANQGAVIKER